MKKICIFPSNPINTYFTKGEIKPRYFNPCNFFDEVHILSPCERDIEEDKVQLMAGDAKLKIHPIGRLGLFSFFSQRNRALKLISSIKPNVIRAYDPLKQGYLAVYCGKKLKIPTVVSIHADYSVIRNLVILGLRPQIFGLMASRILTQPYVLRNATKVICAYNFLLPHVRKIARRDDIEKIYNRVDTVRFKKRKKMKSDVPTILCVGNQIRGKNPEPIVKAIKDLKVRLVLIGNGPLHPRLKQLVADLKIKDKVKFIKSVPNVEIHEYYGSADIFASSLEWGGISIPILEAMASSLPIVVSKSKWERDRELVGGIAITVENDSESFKKAFEKLLSNSKLREKLGREGRKRALEIDEKIMEKKEARVYKELFSWDIDE